MVFGKTPDFDVLWVFQLRNTHRHKPHSKQTNPQEKLVSKQRISSLKTSPLALLLVRHNQPLRLGVWLH